ncbi:MAG: hypothetical protein A2939_03415 [Parcubacteria group bacterium RIFCSPLOWO2_01_FULL_48_18]|nr:MAG: hypothetical protein A3J67_03300 [Parcubacteria group bacterium RIFCSPHIGHO2_02_FULL_48_10b]OHB22832.1 MAG: hypothetical protein A2939_03415 [Parcubacteria group bacterium RIFCSPLOWO2_01_FULL_48_18]
MEDKEQNNSKEYKIPDDILGEINAITEGDFWQTEYLTEQFDGDITFGAKMWGGLYEVLKKAGVEEAKIQEFNERAEVILLANTKPAEAAQKLIELREWIAESFHIPMSSLSARDILYEAYVSEAQAMEWCGIDPNKNPPFSFSLGLNEDHPLVQEVKKQDDLERVKGGTEILDKLIETSPSFKRKVEEFQRSLQPPHDRIE